MKKTIAAGCLALCTLGATSALAADEAANVIKYRQNVMKTIGGNIGAIVGVVKGEVSYTGNVAAHARGINEMSKLITGAFPKGTDNKMASDTRALPTIWEDWPKFEAAAKALESASANMIQIAEAGDPSAFGGALQEVGKACGGCHKPFRAEKK